MPLSEISHNVRRTQSGAGEKVASEGGSTSTPSLPTNAIQSMLKTTTELGDLGQFTVRSSRLPRSGTRHLAGRPRSGSFDASFSTAHRHHRPPHGGRPPRHHGHRPGPSMSGLGGRNISQSNLSSYTNASRRRRHPRGPPQYPPYGPSFDASGQRGLHHHRSSMTLRTHSGIPSRSPMIYPGGFREPPHRAGSPAYSDVRSMSHTPRSGFMRAPSVNTMGSSPGSMYPRHYGPPGYRSDLNASYTSLARLPSPSVSFNRHNLQPAPVPLRISTPSSIMMRQQQARASNVSLAGIPKSPTGSTVPQYYDYSESFTEENCFSPDGDPDNTQPPLNLDETILDSVPSPPARDAQTPFGTKEGSSFHPIELPTEHNRPASVLSQPSFNGVIPKRVSSLGAPAMHKSSPEVIKIRRTRSEDSGPSDIANDNAGSRRPSVASRRSMSPSSSSIFFSNAARSSRDLTSLAARVHSPPTGTVRKLTKLNKDSLHAEAKGEVPEGSHKKLPTRSPERSLPKFSFRPISFEWYSPSPSARPRTSEATPIRKIPEILSPTPERPMSSQSRKRFSKILEIGDTYDGARAERSNKPFGCLKPPTLKRVEEAPDHKRQSLCDAAITSFPAQDDFWDPGKRISHVTSIDKSTIESLLDKHIECLGLQPETDLDSDDATSLQDRRIESLSSGNDTVKLSHLLANVPAWQKGRPITSSSYRQSSLMTQERQKLRPRRLFASMDAGASRKNEARSNLEVLSDFSNQSKSSGPSYGWQTLQSISRVQSDGSPIVVSPESGELGDIDSSDQQTRFKVNRRSDLSLSGSKSSLLSKSASSMLTPKETTPHRRSRSEVLARQDSHRRRRIRIRLKLTTKSKTVGNLADSEVSDPPPKTFVQPQLMKRTSTRRSSIKSPVEGFAELSADPIMPSKVTSPRSQSPPIPTRWSSIIAAMPEPGKRVVEVIRKASNRTVRSHQSNDSVVKPVNTSRVNAPLPRLGSIPRLAPPDFGPPLASSDLNLSLPYADMPSTIRPTLRETKSFFSDESSARRQRTSIRQKFNLNSLRNVLPGSAGHSPLVNMSNGTPAKLRFTSISEMREARYDEEDSSLPADMMGMSEYAYRKRKLLERLKGWWRRQCVSRVRKRKGERIVPGGVPW